MQVPATATVERNDATAMGQKSLGVPSLLTHFIDTTVETIGNIARIGYADTKVFRYQLQNEML